VKGARLRLTPEKVESPFPPATQYWFQLTFPGDMITFREIATQAK